MLLATTITAVFLPMICWRPTVERPLGGIHPRQHLLQTPRPRPSQPVRMLRRQEVVTCRLGGRKDIRLRAGRTLSTTIRARPHGWIPVGRPSSV